MIEKCSEWANDKEQCLAALAEAENGLQVDPLLISWALHYLSDEVLSLRYRIGELESMLND